MTRPAASALAKNGLQLAAAHEREGRGSGTGHALRRLATRCPPSSSSSHPSSCLQNPAASSRAFCRISTLLPYLLGCCRCFIAPPPNHPLTMPSRHEPDVAQHERQAPNRFNAEMASVCAWAAAKRNHRMASVRSFVTPLPFSNMSPKLF